MKLSKRMKKELRKDIMLYIKNGGRIKEYYEEGINYFIESIFEDIDNIEIERMLYKVIEKEIKEIECKEL